MPDKNHKFHEFALSTSLFKGQHDAYYCYVKAEKIAHVLFVLQQRGALLETPLVKEFLISAALLPRSISRCCADEIPHTQVLGAVFSLLSMLRLVSTQNAMHKDNVRVFVQEYEHLAERFSNTGGNLSPYISIDDFAVSIPPAKDAATLSLSGADRSGIKGALLKDTYKGHKGTGADLAGGERASLILDLVRKHKSVSIKDISAVITNCSEKTIQRELSALIQQGFVKKEGDRRWSVYLPV